MKSFRKIVSLFIFLFIARITYASDADALSAMLNNVHAMRADFVQTIYDNRNKAIQQSSGHMALSRPGKFRWEVVKPIPQLIIANESRLWVYDKDLEQVTIRVLREGAGDAPALLLSHVNTQIGKDFAVSETKKNSAKDERWFTLTPKAADNMFASVLIGFKQNEVSNMELKDHLGHTTKVQFNHIENNVTLPASLFVFTPPKNVDVIDETRKK